MRLEFENKVLLFFFYTFGLSFIFGVSKHFIKRKW